MRELENIVEMLPYELLEVLEAALLEYGKRQVKNSYQSVYASEALKKFNRVREHTSAAGMRISSM